MPATTRPARWARSLSGRPPPFARNTSRIRGRSFMHSKSALMAGLCGAAVAAASAAIGEGIDKQDFGQIERGRYLTVAGDCTGCHTLPGSGHEFAGGRNIETPFGLLIGPNITPDPQTGIGAGTDDEFVNALTNGTGRNGEAALSGHAL